MRFEPLTDANKLPAIGAGAEHAMWELKKELNPIDFEMGKDVAAFANHFGGTILIGAKAESSRVISYHPMTSQRADKVEEAIKEAVKARCSPIPTLDYSRLRKDGGVVLAVNVWPAISTVIGVKVKGDTTDGYGDDVWAFPVRLVSHTNTITPSEFSMYMLPTLRRTLLLLYAIPADASITLYFQLSNAHAGVRPSASTGYSMGRVNERENYVVFIRDQDKHEQRAPLDGIYQVYCANDQGGRQTWNIHVFN